MAERETQRTAVTEKGCAFLVFTFGLWPLWLLLYALITPDEPKPAPTETAKMFGNIQSSPGQQAGYDWARQNGIVEHDQCRGNSESFVDGCREYVTEGFIDIGCDPDQAFERCDLPD